MNDYAKALQVALENYRAYAEGLEVQLKDLRDNRHNWNVELHQMYSRVCKDYDKLSNDNALLEKYVDKLKVENKLLQDRAGKLTYEIDALKELLHHTECSFENFQDGCMSELSKLKMELAIANETITAERANTTSWMETAGSLSDKVRKLQEQLDNGDDETCYDYDDIEERYDDIDTREAY